MGIRGELFTTTTTLENRSYFFNVKENRTGDVFLQIVESKNKEGSGFDRQAIVIFEDDMQQFLKGLDDSLSFIEKSRKTRKAEKRAKEAAKKAAEPPVVAPRKKTTTTGRVHVVAKAKKEK